MIDAHLEEGRINPRVGDEEEHVNHAREQRVKPLVSIMEATTLLQQVISGAEKDEEVSKDGTFTFVNSNLEGSRLAGTERKCVQGASSSGTIKDLILSEPNQEVTPQLVVRLDPCGPIVTQLTPVGFSLTQARLLAWASILHANDLEKPKQIQFSVIITDIEDSPGEEKNKRRRQDMDDTNDASCKKLKLEPVKRISEIVRRLAKGKNVVTRRIKEIKKIARDKEGRKKMARLKKEEDNSTMMIINAEAEEAGHTQPPKFQ